MRASNARPLQGLLFPIEGDRANGSGFKDPAFVENRIEPVHRWVPWIAGFSSGFVRDVLDRYASRHRRKTPVCVVDPFAGVGTTLLEAVKRGQTAIGFEINPYAALAARTKLRSFDANLRSFRNTISRFEKWPTDGPRNGCRNRTGPPPQPPKGFRTREPFFSPAVERKVLNALGFIETLNTGLTRDLFRLAFASVMVKFSNYSYEPSLTRRSSSGKSPIDDAPVSEIVTAKLREMEEDIANLQNRNGRPNAPAKWEVYEDSCLVGKAYLKARSVDLVITSPPYLNNYHYVRNTRPQSYWLGLVSSTQDASRLERQSFGTFWQTVREQAPVSLAVDYPELQTTLNEVRARNPEKGIYGGAGWANYAATYFNDCRRLAAELKRILKPGARAVVVIGNSILQGVEIRTDVFLAGICDRLGLTVEGIEILRKKRTGSSIINSTVRVAGAPGRVELYESAVVVSASEPHNSRHPRP